MTLQLSGVARHAIPLLAIASIAASLPAQRIHRFNPTFPPGDPDGFINGEPPDTSNWPHPAAPDGNPFPRSTASIAEIAYRNTKVTLGKLLFFEEQMSSDNSMACFTCHSMSHGGTDMRDGALPGNLGGSFGMIPQHQVSLSQVDYGHLFVPAPGSIDRQFTGRHTPTMIGAYVFNIQFWDGRAGPAFDDPLGAPFPTFTDWAGLEDQAADPPVSDVEMAHQGINWTSGFIQRKLNPSMPMALIDPATLPPDMAAMVANNLNYGRLFDKVYFNDPDPSIGGAQGVTQQRIAMAIAHYERTLIPDRAPIDTGTLSRAQMRGFLLMRDAGCFGCHSITGGAQGSTTPVIGPNGTLVDPFDNPFSDGDRHDILIGTGLIKTPTLRNVGLRKRFFSDGSFNDIDKLLDFYNSRPNPLGFAGITPVQLEMVKDFLVNGLLDQRVPLELPPFDRPILASERPEFSPFEVNEYGSGTPGPSGLTPEIVANCPPLVIGPVIGPMTTNWFKVGVGETVANASAFLMISNAAANAGPVWLGPLINVFNAGPTNGAGIATAHVPFPLTLSTVGVDFFVQWLIDDNGVSAFSNAAKFTPFKF